MKKLFVFITAALMVAITFAQAPEKLNFQAVIRNASGEPLVNQRVGIQITVLQGSPSGSAVFAETHNLLTNSFGLISIEIGSGTPVTGSVAGIGWNNGPFYIKTETDPNGGNNYSVTSTSQLLSVPYALHAKTAENVDDADADPSNEIQSLSISGYELTLNKTGGSVTLPASGGTGIQGVQNSNNTLAIANPNGPIADIGLKLPFSAATSTSATTFAVANQSNGAGLSGSSEQGDGITGSSASGSKSGIWGNNTGGGYGIAGSTSGGSTAGVWGTNSSSGFGLKGTSSTGAGVYGSSAGTGASYGVVGESTANSGTGIGVYGRSGSQTGTGVYGWANNANGSNYGVYGETGSTAGYGGYFVGRGYFSGDVGIGTTNPQAPLHVANHIRVGQDNTYPAVYGEMRHDGGSNGFVINANAGGGGWGDIHLQTNGTTKMFIESQGNVGIGTTNPTAKLHVIDATGGDESVILPFGSIGHGEMQNEPGLVVTSDVGKYLETNGVLEEISLAIINAPSDGFVFAIASFQVTCIPVEFQSGFSAKFIISKTNVEPPIPLDAYHYKEIVFNNLEQEVFKFPVSFTDVYDVSTGINYFYFLGKNTSGLGNIGILRPQLTLIFLPTGYGKVSFYGSPFD